jgi:hypothetical protein
MPGMTHAERIRALAWRLHEAGGTAFVEDSAGSQVYSWKLKAGRWPLEIQADRYALMVRAYLGDELLCTGRMTEQEAEFLARPMPAGRGDPEAMAELAQFVEEFVAGNSRRFLRPPHADRHPDRRLDPRQQATVRALPGRRIDEPA